MAHTYIPANRFDIDSHGRPHIGDGTFHDARDVVAFAEAGGVDTGVTSCESWHLDPDGRFVCGTRGTSADSLERWAADPERLVRAYLDSRVVGSCTPRWVVVDCRPHVDVVGPDGSGLRPVVPVVITEADPERFLRLQRQLDVIGITLLDAVVFDGRGRWWSLRELVTGSIRWPQRARVPTGNLGVPERPSR